VDNRESSFVPGPVVATPASFPQPAPNPPLALIGPNNPPWGTLGAVATWIASVVFLFFVPIVTVLPYLVYRATAGGSAGPPDVLLHDKNFIFFSVLGVIPAHLLTLGLTWLVVTKAGRYPFWKTLGWEWPPHFGPWKSVGVAIVLLGIGLLITYFVGGNKTELDELINSSYRTRLTTAFLAATTGPLVEEVVYRGVLYSVLQRALGIVWAVLIVSILFAGVHVYQYRNNAGVIAVITLLSITLTLVRAYSGRLLPSFMIHFVFNGIQSVLLVVQPFFEKPEQALPQKASGYLIAILLRYFV
jgi:uncharacterized protein